MPVVIYVLLAILGLNLIGNSIIVGKGGADEPKSADTALLDILLGAVLIVWLLAAFL